MENLGLGGAVILIGLLVVFVILLILVAICVVLGKVLGHSKKPAAPKPSANPPKAEPLPAVRAAAAPTPARGEDDGVVAAISAAVAVMMEGKPFAITGIRRKTGPARAGRNAWNAAGVAENTRTF